MNGVEPYAWLKGTLEKIAAGHDKTSEPGTRRRHAPVTLGQERLALPALEAGSQAGGDRPGVLPRARPGFGGGTRRRGELSGVFAADRTGMGHCRLGTVHWRSRRNG